MEDSSDAERSPDRPARDGCPAADDSVEVEQMNRNGLDRLRRVFTVMLDAVCIAP